MSDDDYDLYSPPGFSHYEPTWKVIAQYLGGLGIIVAVCFALAKLT